MRALRGTDGAPMGHRTGVGGEPSTGRVDRGSPLGYTGFSRREWRNWQTRQT